MNTQDFKRLQFRRMGKRIASSAASATTLGNAEERAVAFTCCRKPRVLKQIAWRLKLRWRSHKTCNGKIQCGYDLRSYHLNFDDNGFSRRR